MSITVVLKTFLLLDNKRFTRTLCKDGMEGREQFPGAGKLICREWKMKHKRFK
jgi:hypothetical protein